MALINGTEFDDVLNGTTDPDVINGLNGDDTLNGLDGADEINGGAGDDFLYGASGDDVLEGGEGRDELRGGSGDDLFYWSPDGDWINGGTGFDTISFESAAVGVQFQMFNTEVQTLFAGETVEASGLERVIGSAFDDYLLLGFGISVLESNGVVEIYEGRGGDDRLSSDNDSHLFGGEGDDFLSAGPEAVLEGGSGADELRRGIAAYETAAASVTINLQTGVHTGDAAGDTFGDGSGRVASWRLSSFDDAFVGLHTGGEVVDGGAGDDNLFGGAGDDTLIGGLGDDILNGSTGVDTVSYAGSAGGVSVNLLIEAATGAAGNDTVAGFENIVGSAFADVLRGNGAANHITGGAGDDVLDGFLGVDTTVGGLGDDQHWVDSAADVVVEAAGEGALDRVFAWNSYALGAAAEIEILSTALQAGTAAIDLTGNGFGQTVVGNNGLNVLDGGGGDDVILGHLGDDVLIGGAGDDRLDGGLGTDRASYAAAASGVSASLTTGTASGGAGADVLLDIENLTGSAFADVLTGAAGSNVLSGGAGDDRLDGRAGADTTIGGAGDDWHYVDDAGDMVVETAGQGAADRVFASASYGLTAGAEVEILSTVLQSGSAAIDLTGNELANTVGGNAGANRLEGAGGADSLYGHGGADTLVGGTGDDTLWGGAGTDTFLYDAGAFGADLIRDFENGIDVIRVEGIAGVDDVSDLSVSNNAQGWAVITFPDGSTVSLFGVDAGLVDASDFVFGP